MDIDRISYIFGSFARRRQSQEPGSETKRRSIVPTKIFHDRSKSTPHHTNKIPTYHRPRSVHGLSLDGTKYKCPMCRRQFVEPRVLPCLHTFCLRCLEGLERNDFATWYDDDSDVPRTGSTGSRKASSGGSGYVSDRQHDDSPGKAVCCPTCGARAEVPPGGVTTFPPNYTLQHRMVLATLNSHATHLLCDMCATDVSATSRCMECAVSFCIECKEIHLRQKSSASHEVLSLEEARGRGITKIRRQVLCVKHPELELSIFCTTCFQVICRDCISASHRGHLCEPISRVAKTHLTDFRLAMERAKSLVEKSAVETSRLNATSKRIESQCNKVQSEVERFIDDYIKSVEEHKIGLLEQIEQVREDKLQNITQEKLKLQKRIKDARDIAYFLDDLLNEGTDVEVLSFVKPVMNRIEKCDNLESIPDLKCLDSLQFLPEEKVKSSDNIFNLYGVLTTQRVDPEHCCINTEGLPNLRIGRKAEVILETRDTNNEPLERGGEYVTAEIRHKDAGVSRSLVVNVNDRRDGTYKISFIPEVAGKLILIIKIRGEPIKESPFPINVRTLKPHQGTFHCCSFCSSGGSKEATCGCEGKMPGGYKGCGHGHEGHPGRRHWSCCGNMLEHSECSRSRSSSQYQFTL